MYYSLSVHQSIVLQSLHWYSKQVILLFFWCGSVLFHCKGLTVNFIIPQTRLIFSRLRNDCMSSTECCSAYIACASPGQNLAKQTWWRMRALSSSSLECIWPCGRSHQQPSQQALSCTYTHPHATNTCDFVASISPCRPCFTIDSLLSATTHIFIFSVCTLRWIIWKLWPQVTLN